MATKCRKPTIIRNRGRFVSCACVALGLSIATGFAVGRYTAPVKVETVTETMTVIEKVEVPVLEERPLPEVEDVFFFDVPLSQSLQRFIWEVSADENVPVTLVFAMIEHESGFNPEAMSYTDDFGLMQINKINHEWLAEEYRAADMLNAYQNVFCGIKIIAHYLEKFDGNFHRALMSYNLGGYGAMKAWENGIESTSYSESIVKLMKKYEGELNDADDH